MSRVRWDRLLTVAKAAVSRPFAGTSRSGERVLPILMYHSVSDDAEPGIGAYYKLCTSPRLFAQHLSWLRAAGYQGTDLATGLEYLKTGALAQGRPPVAITFDDGFRDFHDAALPALEQAGFTATVYLPTAFIRAPRTRFLGRECMTWEEILRCCESGITFGSHTVSHPLLITLDFEAIRRELRESRLEIEDRIRRPVDLFAHPYAFPQADAGYTQRFRELLQECGYTSNTTTILGRATAETDPFQLPRLPANEADDQQLLVLKTQGHYDWMALPQRLAKRLRRKVQSS